jgi:hypothetical protein
MNLPAGNIFFYTLLFPCSLKYMLPLTFSHRYDPLINIP